MEQRITAVILGATDLKRRDAVFKALCWKRSLTLPD